MSAFRTDWIPAGYDLMSLEVKLFDGVTQNILTLNFDANQGAGCFVNLEIDDHVSFDPAELATISQGVADIARAIDSHASANPIPPAAQRQPTASRPAAVIEPQEDPPCLPIPF